MQPAPIYLRYIRIPFQMNCRASAERVQLGPINLQYISLASQSFLLPCLSYDILRYILSCRAIAIYDLPINLQYIFKRVSPLATILTSSEREIRSENALSRPEEHSFDLLTEIVADEDGCFYMNPFRSLIIFLSHF